ncbi:cation:proton antiporter [Streptomyces sp. NPDC127190]|uniref:cation:proton antiporter domain-containing protein n=1 Tax=unclassified Streptomyces TaxID=2593676 RepID=UPI00363D3B70
MPPIDLLFLDIVVILAAARVFGAAAVALRQPRVLGEIAAGIALGPTLLGHLGGGGLFPATVLPPLKTLAAVGLVLFMFVVGMELDQRLIRGRGRVVTGVAVGATLVPLVLGCSYAFWLAPRYAVGGHLPFVLFFGVSVSATAFPVLARIITERGMQKTLIGGIALACAAVIDIVAYGLLGLAVALNSASGHQAWRLLLVPVYLLVMFGLVRPLLRRVTEAAEPLPYLLIGLFASAWVTEWLQVHYIFGAFVFGAVMPRSEALLTRLTERLEPAVHLMLPVFFAVTGLTVDLTGLRPAQLGVLAAVLAIAVFGKLGGGYAAARLSGIPHRGSAVVATLVNARGLTELVILSVGLEQGLLDVRLYAMLLVMALVTTAMTGPLLGWSYPADQLREDLAAADRERQGAVDGARRTAPGAGAATAARPAGTAAAPGPRSSDESFGGTDGR